MAKRFWNRIFRGITVLLGLWLAWDLLAHLVAEILWFIEVGYLSAFLLRLQTQLSLWSIVSSLSIGFLLGNLFLANRLKYSPDIADWVGTYDNKPPLSTQFDSPLQPSAVQVEKVPKSTPVRLRSLLPAVVLLDLLLGLMLLHYGKIALSAWHSDFRLPYIAPSLPSAFDWTSLQGLLLQLPVQIGLLVALVVVVIALVVNPQFWLTAIAIVLSLCWSLVLSGQWSRVLQYFSPTAFNADDPLFGQDISFYVFKFPLWQLLDFWLGGLFLVGLVIITITYLVSGDSLSQGKFPGFSENQLRHLYGLGGAFAGTVAFRYWLSRYELLYSFRGVTYGASYTDVNAQLPINTRLSLLAGAIALFLLFKAINNTRHLQNRNRLALTVVGLYAIIAAIAGWGIPVAVQRFNVQPNELERERPYIERSIALTRAGFDLSSINTQIFNPEGDLTSADLGENVLTIRNIRLWDTRPILDTNRQLQRIRLYYEFPDADIDRYVLPVEQAGVPASFEGEEGSQPKVEVTDSPLDLSPPPFSIEKQQVIIAPRELNYQSVPEEAQTWVNQHLVYTHGYGFTMSPVNRVGSGGLPNYFVKDIGTGADPGVEGNLSTSSELIREYIPIGAPRLYYGQLTENYVMTPTKVPELDYPSGEENVYNTYDGKGGVPLGSVWQRLLFAQYLKDWQMLFTRNFIPQTKVLFRRNIDQRIRAIAPFLRYDRDPYLVTADAGKGESGVSANHLYWIIDAYTTSDRYPYSDPGNNSFNYIRNSVKVVINAYDGDITFYVAAPEDPIIQTWSKILPGFFQPLDAMPPALLSHIRYPVDIFSVQSERLLIYHMTDPQVFYNREDQWRIPQEIYGGELQSLEPYYLIMKLPTATKEEFILLHPFTPKARNNLIAWLAGRSDSENYGKLLLYQFPKQELIYGPEQVEALINQDPVISQQISLWNRQGSQAIQGNLLVIPIEQSLLYVEPLYLEAERNSLPILARVIVVYENRIVMAETLEEALQGIFEREQQTAPTIIRPLEESTLPLE
ncbi:MULTISPECIES: UPF0182 family protein [unclassified Coleofasciculus]|uniref:UPF0182 family protein n=1 Tax=unclassified Coleofasciculus TaxID=2692782 RepID=UPI001882F4E3|nr:MULTISPECIES: UPF0182 family protein [unclassified Coleofasciculus]MBE9127231.1 UPF0182 family protein [Coleofasciculus sp. LEGE 07081]MBE9150523.1 UPF0182 family protein [Coleofasciculus sp. LEGE 07092]